MNKEIAEYRREFARLPKAQQRVELKLLREIVQRFKDEQTRVDRTAAELLADIDLDWEDGGAQ